MMRMVKLANAYADAKARAAEAERMYENANHFCCNVNRDEIVAAESAYRMALWNLDKARVEWLEGL
jgi:hypothetical protein